MKDLTFRIRHARRGALLSQNGLATEVGVNRSAVAQWERPMGSRPTSGNLAKIAVATSIHFEWLATGRGPMKDKLAEGESTDQHALQPHCYAHDEVEERVLLGLRKLQYCQSLSVAELVESLARGRLVA